MEGGRSKIASGFLAILFGLMGALFMATKHLVIRYYKDGYSGFDQALDSAILEGAL